MNFRVGDTVGGYEVTGIIASGGMGEVYRVCDPVSGRVEAMKVLRADLEARPELADRFAREIRLHAQLDHPHIAALRESFEFAGKQVMVMEMVEGMTLSERLRRGFLPLREAVRVAIEALSALGCAHERAIVHRDIKPANIMLTEAGAVKLMDFGIARAVTDRSLTRAGQLLGSLHYMSPEQVLGEDVDTRSDLYSLGVVLYEMATGQKPFDGKSDYSIMKAHLEEPPVPPGDWDASIPAALSGVILEALAKDPADRFASAEAFSHKLEQAGRELPEGLDSAEQGWRAMSNADCGHTIVELPAEPTVIETHQTTEIGDAGLHGLVPARGRVKQ